MPKGVKLILLLLILSCSTIAQTFQLGVRAEMFMWTKLDKPNGTEYYMLPLPTAFMLNAGVSFNKYLNFDLRVGPELITEDLLGMKYGLIFKSFPIKDWFYFLGGLELHQNAASEAISTGSYNSVLKLGAIGIGFIATKALSFEFAFLKTLGDNAYTYGKGLQFIGSPIKIPANKIDYTIKFGIGFNWQL